MQMFRDTKARNLSSLPAGRLLARLAAHRRGDLQAREGGAHAPAAARSTREEAERLHQAIQATKIMAPPTDCIAPIGEELIERALRAEVKADFYAVDHAPRRASTAAIPS